MSNLEQQVNELSSRLRAFAIILRFGHDLFGTKDFADAAAQVVNNSWTLLNFKSSVLIEEVNGKAAVIAQYGQAQVNSHSRQAVLQADLCSGLKVGPEPLTLTLENSKDLDVPHAVLEELMDQNTTYYIFEMVPPEAVSDQPFRFLWLIEYDKNIPSFALNSAKLLSSTIAEALYFHRLCTNPMKWRLRKHMSLKKMFLLILLLVIVACMFIRVPESATAEFTLKAPDITSTYAWFEGPIAKCLKQEGQMVQEGEVIVEYDTSQLMYRLAAAESRVREIEVELDNEQRASFKEKDRLANVKLLEPRLETARIEVAEAKWYLSKSQIVAPASGTLVLADGRAEMLIGKVVHAGEKIFDIYGGEGKVAEIPVDQRNSSVLLDNLEATLFLHTAPEKPIAVKIMEISPYPELTEQRTYCYIVLTELPPTDKDLRYGMRGIAKLSGGRVSLGYYLFKSVVLYLRGI